MSCLIVQSCVHRRYVEHEKSQIVNTSWAIMSLMAADWPDPEPIRRGIEVWSPLQTAEWVVTGSDDCTVMM